jgi:hypothetical protein
MNTSDTVNAEPRLKPLYSIGGAATLFAVAIYLIHLIVFSCGANPRTHSAGSNCLRTASSEGFLAFELLLVVSSALGIATTLALYAALRRVNESLSWPSLWSSISWRLWPSS